MLHRINLHGSAASINSRTNPAPIHSSDGSVVIDFALARRSPASTATTRVSPATPDLRSSSPSADTNASFTPTDVDKLVDYLKLPGTGLYWFAEIIEQIFELAVVLFAIIYRFNLANPASRMADVFAGGAGIGSEVIPMIAAKRSHKKAKELIIAPPTNLKLNTPDDLQGSLTRNSSRHVKLALQKILSEDHEIHNKVGGIATAGNVIAAFASTLISGYVEIPKLTAPQYQYGGLCAGNLLKTAYIQHAIKEAKETAEIAYHILFVLKDDDSISNDFTISAVKILETYRIVKTCEGLACKVTLGAGAFEALWCAAVICNDILNTDNNPYGSDAEKGLNYATMGLGFLAAVSTAATLGVRYYYNRRIKDEIQNKKTDTALDASPQETESFISKSSVVRTCAIALEEMVDNFRQEATRLAEQLHVLALQVLASSAASGSEDKKKKAVIDAFKALLEGNRTVRQCNHWDEMVLLYKMLFAAMGDQNEAVHILLDLIFCHPKDVQQAIITIVEILKLRDRM